MNKVCALGISKFLICQVQQTQQSLFRRDREQIDKIIL
jgi:hypothetical protein